MAYKDITGQKFGPWTVLHVAPRPTTSQEGGKFWLCECACTRKTREIINGGRLRAGRAARGCFHCRKPHGPYTGTSTHESYRGMLDRCTRPSHSSWKNYGGRGITICERWLESYNNFRADMGERPPKMSLDRIDNDGNYEPGNCRWADSKTQAHNSKNVKLTDEQVDAICRLIQKGATQIDVAEACGVSRGYVGVLARESSGRRKR